MTVSEKFTDYGKKVEAELKAHGFRVNGDYRPEKIGYKIREAQMEKIPYVLVVGDEDAEAGTVGVNMRHADRPERGVPVDEFVERLAADVTTRR